MSVYVWLYCVGSLVSRTVSFNVLPCRCLTVSTRKGAQVHCVGSLVSRTVSFNVLPCRCLTVSTRYGAQSYWMLTKNRKAMKMATVTLMQMALD